MFCAVPMINETKFIKFYAWALDKEVQGFFITPYSLYIFRSDAELINDISIWYRSTSYAIGVFLHLLR